MNYGGGQPAVRCRDRAERTRELRDWLDSHCQNTFVVLLGVCVPALK